MATVRILFVKKMLWIKQTVIKDEQSNCVIQIKLNCNPVEVKFPLAIIVTNPKESNKAGFTGQSTLKMNKYLDFQNLNYFRV